MSACNLTDGLPLLASRCYVLLIHSTTVPGLYPRRFLVLDDKPLAESHVRIPRYLDFGFCQALHYRLALFSSTSHILILETHPRAMQIPGEVAAVQTE